MRLIIFVHFMNFLRHGMIFPLIPLFAHKMGCSSVMIGVAVSCFNLLPILIALPVGKLSERLPIKALFLLAAFSNLIYSILLIAAHNVWVLILAQMTGGFGFLLLVISGQTWISEYTERRIRERGFGLLTLAAAVGQTIGPILGGFVLSSTSFDTVYSLAVIFSLIGFSIIGLPSGAQKEKRVGRRTGTSIKKAIARFTADRKMCAILIFAFVAAFAASLRFSFVPVLFKAQNINEGTIGFLLSIFALSMTLVRFIIGRAMGRLTREMLLGLAMTLFFAAIISLPSTSQVWLLGGIMFLFGIGFGISQPLSLVMVSDRAGENSGLAMSFRFLLINLGMLISPVITGFMVEGFGLTAAFYFVGVVFFSAGILIFFLGYKDV
ncbi:MAG: MFS transporter [Desulfobacteraceae bacterium]|nr:MFS transporter [Desulfobacteraceae bacterium]